MGKCRELENCFDDAIIFGRMKFGKSVKQEIQDKYMDVENLIMNLGKNLIAI